VALDLSTQAAEKSTNSDVKQFAQRILEDQTKVDTELKDLTIQKGVALDSVTTRATVLKGAGDEFDRAYLKRIVAVQEKDVTAFEKASQGAVDPQIRAFAEKTLPKLRDHLQLARALNQKRQ
jgi:putative membrane protein